LAYKKNLFHHSPSQNKTHQMNSFTCFLFSCLILSCFTSEFPNVKVKDNADDIMKFWTRERMMNAKPMDLPVLVDFKSLKSNSTIKDTSIVTAAYSTMPYKAAGRLFFSTATGGASCS
jgi:hypothetical protein